MPGIRNDNPFFHAQPRTRRISTTSARGTTPQVPTSMDRRDDALTRHPTPFSPDIFTSSSSSRVLERRPIAKKPSITESLRQAFRLDERGDSRPGTPSTTSSTQRPRVTFAIPESNPLTTRPVTTTVQEAPVDPQPPQDAAPEPNTANKPVRGFINRMRSAARSLAPRSRSEQPPARNDPIATQPPPVPTGRDLLRQLRREGTTHDQIKRGVLSELPGLLRQQGRERNGAIAQKMEALLATLPEGDERRRTELARTAAAFLDASDADSHAQAKGRIADAALGARASEATPAQKNALLGTEGEQRSAVVSSMPQWLANVPAPIVPAMLDRLPAHIANAEGRHHLRAQATRFIAAREGHTADQPARLPENLQWLRSAWRQDRVVEGYRRRASHGSNRFLPDQVAQMAADLKALKSVKTGRMHHDLRPDFLRFVETLFNARDRRDGTPLVYSRDRLEILLNLVEQPMTDSGPLQNQVLKLVRRQMNGTGLTQTDRAELVKALARMAPNYNNSRVQMRNHQGPAMEAISAGTRNLPASRTAEVLTEVTHQLPHLSTHRNASGDQPGSLNPLNLAGYAARQAGGGFMTFGLFNVTTWLANVVGGRSPATEGMHVINQGIGRLLHVGAEADTASSMLPLVRELLNQPPEVRSSKIYRKLHQKALAGLVRGGLPFGLTPERRTEMIEAGIGNDPARRTEIARELQAVAGGEGIGRKTSTRQAAARYLHHLVQAGGHRLSEADVQRANATILGAFRRNVDGTEARDASSIMSALLSELPRSGPQRDEALVGELSSRIMRGIARPEAMAEAIGPLTSSYDSLPARSRREIAAALDRAVPRNPAQRGRAAQGQRLPLKTILGLSNFVGSDPAPLVEELALPMFQRMNRDYRDSTFNQLFDAFAEAPPTGQRAVIHFLSRLEDPNEFINGARQMARRMLADDETRDKADPQAYEQGVAMLRARLPKLDKAHLSEALRGIVEGNPDLPVPVLQVLLRRAHRADHLALRELLGNVVNSLPMREPAEADALKKSLDELSGRLAADPVGRGTVHAFMKVADLRPRRPESIMLPEEHEHLASQLPGMNATLARRTLGDIAQANLPEDVSHGVVDSTLKHYARFPADGRRDVLKYTAPKNPRLTFHTLAGRVGTPEFVNGKPVRPTLRDQQVPQPQGDDVPLQQLLMAQPADVVQASLEALGEKVFGVPKAQRDEIVGVLSQRNHTLPPAHQRRLAETMLLAEGRQLSDAEIRSVGGNPAHPIWRFPEQLKLHERQDRLKALRDSRLRDPSQWPEQPAAEAAGSGMPFVKPQAPAEASTARDKRHSAGLFHRDSQRRRSSVSSQGSGA